jgi:hypothetical protein
MSQHDYVISNDDGASVRADVNSMGVAIKSNNSSPSTFPASPVQGMPFTQNLSATQQLEWKYDGAAWRLLAIIDPTAGKVYPTNVRTIAGLTLSNNGSDATNDIDIAAGWTAADSDGHALILTAAITKRLDAAWAVGTNQGGLDTGAIANTTYHVWLIRRPDTGVVDVLFSASATAPTMPTNYTQKRRIGSIIRASAAIVAFQQFGNYFARNVIASDYYAPNPGTSAVTVTLSAPTGIALTARIVGFLNDASVASATFMLVTSLDQADTTPSITAYTLRTGLTNAGPSFPMDIKTNTSAQVRYRLDQSTADHVVGFLTAGWTDMRGQDAA